VRYTFAATVYEIVVRQEAAAEGAEVSIGVSVDGVVQRDGAVRLVDDGASHRVDVVLGAQQAKKNAASSTAPESVLDA